MATVALWPQSAPVHVILFMAVDALRLGIAEGLGAMTLRAAHDNM
jgi:hypothetical protein